MSNSEVFRTTKGTAYLKAPKVVCISRPQLVHLEADDLLARFFDGFDKELGFDKYLPDLRNFSQADSDALCKFAGQTCYASFGEKRTPHTEDGNHKYFNNIKESSHGSVLEHANFSFFMYGISRALTHELIRHRAGWAYSQLSQRYVDGKTLRFVESHKHQIDPALHQMFEDWIDACAEQYALRQGRMLLMKNPDDTSRDTRKAINQEARRCLPNETETVMVATANARAIRHVLEMRGSLHADDEIRNWALALLAEAKHVSENLFSDYEVRTDEVTGKRYIYTPYEKV